VNLGSALAVASGWVNVDGSLNAFFARAPAALLRLAYRFSGSRQVLSRDEYCRILRTNRYIHHDFRYGLPFHGDSVDYIYSSHLLEHLFRDDALRLLGEIRRVLKPGGCVRICVPDLAHALALFANGDKDRALEYFFASRRAGRFSRHQYMYDYELLDSALRKTGFAQVARRSFRLGQVPDLDVLDNRPEETLYVEARKAVT
jgi:SAM-dependent methyltransferase